MKKVISTEILIQASPEKVWSIFSDFEKYPEWNPFIRSISGEIKIGNTITAKLEPEGAKGMVFKPTVLTFEKNKEFSWLGRLIMPGLFDGEHKFELKDNKNGSTTFIHSEKFNGILVPLFKKMLDVNTKNGFILMNQKLKELAEK